MSTSHQYDFFRKLFDDESARYEQLQDRAKVYISLITIYGGIVLFKAGSDVHAAIVGRWSTLLLYVLVLLVILALATIIGALMLRDFERVADPAATAEKSDGMTDTEFDKHRIADLAIATERNVKCNDEIAAWLSWTLWVLAAAVAANMALVLSLMLGK